MPRIGRVPKYRLHKTSGRAVVTIDGKDIYLGPYNSPESRAKYDEIIGAWIRDGRRLLKPAGEKGMLLGDLAIAYLAHAKTYYRKEGRPTGEQGAVKAALRFATKLYGSRPVSGFGPLALKECRDDMVRKGLVRTSINVHVGRIKRMIAWGVENELVPGSTLHALHAVRGLRRDRSDAKEGEPTKPAPDADVDAALPQLPPAVADMVRVQRLPGMRPGEVLIMRPCDIDRSGTSWVYLPQSHKTQHHGHRREVILGPRARAILQPYLEKRGDAEYVFSPSRAEEARNARRRLARKSPRTPSQEARGRKADRKRAWGNRYDAGSYRRAVTRACASAGVATWTPRQLRHAMAHEILRADEIETVRTVLGHRSAGISEVYAERDRERAARIIEQVG